MLAKLWRGIATVALVLNILVYFIMGVGTGNYLLVLLGLISGLLSGLIFYTIGEIVDQLEICNRNTYEVYKLLKKIAPEEEKKEKKSYFSAPSAPVAKKSSEGDWTCKKCGVKNGSTDVSCKDCGSYR